MASTWVEVTRAGSAEPDEVCRLEPKEGSKKAVGAAPDAKAGDIASAMELTGEDHSRAESLRIVAWPDNVEMCWNWYVCRFCLRESFV